MTLIVILVETQPQPSSTWRSLSAKLAEKEASGWPIHVGLIGASKFGSMLYVAAGIKKIKIIVPEYNLLTRPSIAQSHRIPGIRVASIADLSIQRALDALKRTGFPDEAYDATAALSADEGIKTNKTAIITDSTKLIATSGIGVVLEVTGNPAAGIRHTLLVTSAAPNV